MEEGSVRQVQLLECPGLLRYGGFYLMLWKARRLYLRKGEKGPEK
jgi:hypothetical protein